MKQSQTEDGAISMSAQSIGRLSRDEVKPSLLNGVNEWSMRQRAVGQNWSSDWQTDYAGK
jgi:hypothetical protein